MYIPREVIGNSGSDSLRGNRGDAVFGLGGNDLLWSGDIQGEDLFKPTFLAGGNGGDTYDATAYTKASCTIIIDNGTNRTDRVNLSGFNSFGILGNKHLVAFSSDASKSLLVWDGFSNTPSTETYFSGFNQWSASQLKDTISSNPATYLGSIPASCVWSIGNTGYGIGPYEITSNYTQAEFENEITHLESRSVQLDPAVTATPPITTVGSSDSVVSAQPNDNLVVGTAVAGTTVTINSGSNILGTTTASNTGGYSYALTAANLTTLGQGTGKSITATASDTAGNVSAASSAFTFAVYTLVNQAPTDITLTSSGITENSAGVAPL